MKGAICLSPPTGEEDGKENGKQLRRRDRTDTPHTPTGSADYRSMFLSPLSQPPLVVSPEGHCGGRRSRL
eukprot:6486169-Pyramimonas_sp.AAC.1